MKIRFLLLAGLLALPFALIAQNQEPVATPVVNAVDAQVVPTEMAAVISNIVTAVVNEKTKKSFYGGGSGYGKSNGDFWGSMGIMKIYRTFLFDPDHIGHDPLHGNVMCPDKCKECPHTVTREQVAAMGNIKCPPLCKNSAGWKSVVMICVALFLVWLSIVKKFEPLLLLPLSFGILLSNLPMAGLSAYDPGNLLNLLYQGIVWVVYPPMIFLCIGTITDMAPLIASPRIALIGIGGQLGIFVALFLAYYMGIWLAPVFGYEEALFTMKQAAAVGVIGSSDGPTSIFAAKILAPEYIAPIAIAAFSYMALVPFIQAPLMRVMTTPKERVIVMPHPKTVTQRQKILFPIFAVIITLLLVPAASPLISMLMLGNLIRESGVADRFVRALSNDVLSVLTLLVALSIGSSANAAKFLTPQTLIIIFCGLVAFAFGTIGGITVAKLLCFFTGGKVNPLIGNSGVSAMPMAARISQRMGQKYNPNNHLLMHAMGPIVSSTIGSAVIAGIFIAYFALKS